MNYGNPIKNIKNFSPASYLEIYLSRTRCCSFSFNTFIKYLYLTLFLGFFAACQMEVKITKNSSAQTPQQVENQDPSFKLKSINSDFVVGEIVTTPNGVVINGTFGDISEKQVLSNQVGFDGLFYE